MSFSPTSSPSFLAPRPRSAPHTGFLAVLWKHEVTPASGTVHLLFPIPSTHFPEGFKAHFLSFFFFLIIICFFIYLWLCWVFVSVRGLSLVVASGGHSSSRCAGLLLSQPLLLWSTGSRRAGSVVVAHGPSCSAACGIFPDQGLNPCPLH